MAQSHPFILRLLASSVVAAGRAGKIIRDVMSRGELGIIEKVRLLNLIVCSKIFFYIFIG